MSHLATHLLKSCPVVLLALVLASCQTSSHIRGLPKNLPAINLHGSTSTPAHGMAHSDYPFEPDGDYNTAWAGRRWEPSALVQVQSFGPSSSMG